MSANLFMRLAGWFIVSGAAAQTSAPFDYPAFLKGVRAPADFTNVLAAGKPVVCFPRSCEWAVRIIQDSSSVKLSSKAEKLW